MSHRSSFRAGQAPASRRRSAPRLERLEDRRLLATFNPDPSAADGSPGSLRDAIIQADSNGQDNTIVLQAAAYVLTVPNTPGQDNGAAQGDLDLDGLGHTITIQGAGQSKTVIDATKLGDRIFKIFPGVTAFISDLTIFGGTAVDDSRSGSPGTTMALGGGLLNAGTTELDRVNVVSCNAEGGSGRDGTPGNSTAAGSAGMNALGGGIYNYGTLTLNQCSVQSNEADGGKGGKGSSSDSASSVGGAGGISRGGGIYNLGSLTVSQSSIAYNQANGGDGGQGGSDTTGIGPAGGQGGNSYGGGIEVASTASKTMIIDATMVYNGATSGSGGLGGQGGTDPTSLQGANGGNGGNGGPAEGGGIDAEAPISLYNSTIADNQVFAEFGGPGGTEGGGVSLGSLGQPGKAGTAGGGGIYGPSAVGVPGVVTSISTIIALDTSAVNTGGSSVAPTTPDDADLTFAYAANTLLQDGGGATGIFDGIAGNLVGVDPKLGGQLRPSDGSPLVLTLLPGSPAIGAGSNPLGLTMDERGSPRVIRGTTDIGAYELGPAPTSGGGGAATASIRILATVVTIKGHRAVRVTDPATGAIKFTIFPFGRGYRGKFAISTITVDSVEDLVVRRPRGHRKFFTKVFDGKDGSRLPSSLA